LHHFPLLTGNGFLQVSRTLTQFKILARERGSFPVLTCRPPHPVRPVFKASSGNLIIIVTCLLLHYSFFDDVWRMIKLQQIMKSLGFISANKGSKRPGCYLFRNIKPSRIWPYQVH